MEITHHLDKKRIIQNLILEFIDDIDNIEEIYVNIMKEFKEQKIPQKKSKLREFLYLILRIANNHHRLTDFLSKIEIILLSLKTEIKQTFSNSQIFTIFKSNKRILLFLIKEEILILDQSIVNAITKGKYIVKNYPDYFSSEIKKFKGEKIDLDEGEFDEKRKIGENDNYICEIIRNDFIEEFIIFANKMNLSLSSQINYSIFETNNFLLKRKSCSYIQYAAFCGSTQIFKYLYFNKACFDESIWAFAVHSDNPELIQFLVGTGFDFSSSIFNEILIESIKCHHNEIICYFQKNLMDDKIEDCEEIIAQSIKYSNYNYFPNDLRNCYYFYFLCKYNFVSLVKALIKKDLINIDTKII